MRHSSKWKPVDKFRTKPISDFVEYKNDCYLNWMLPEREIRRVERMYRVLDFIDYDLVIDQYEQGKLF